MSKSPVVYKDTFDFAVFPKYEYTVPQKRRLRLFQGRVEHWRAAFNYADRFVDDPDKINLLYMIGYDKNMHNWVMKSKSNLVVLCAKFLPEDLKIYDAYTKLIDECRGAGYIGNNNELIERFFADGGNWVANRHLGEAVEVAASKYEKQLSIINA